MKSVTKERTCHILFIAPLCYRPNLPNFRNRFDSLPTRYTGDIICPASPQFDGDHYGNFTLHVLKICGVIGTIASIVAHGLRSHRSCSIDLIHCYDPLTLGIAGLILKRLTGAKLVVEVNGHVLTAGFLGATGLKVRIKKWIVSQVVRLTLGAADGVKCLNQKLVSEMGPFVRQKSIYHFGDFVPVKFFNRPEEDHKFVFFAGHPFYLKGIDVLIKAFKKLSTDFPDYRLVIMGFNNLDLDYYRQMASNCTQIEFRPPIFNDAMPDLYSHCSFFVLPSRSEAMGRVLIEAMAAGKATIGSRIGGIPEVIEDGVTGLLFENENVEDLERQMRRLLADETLRQSMGEAGRKRALEHFSEEVYISSFVSMIDSVIAGEKG